MNQQRHRLVFNRRRGMLVAVAEHASAQGKAASGEGRSGAAAPAAVTATAAGSLAAALATAVTAALAAALGAAPAQAQTARAPVVFASKLAAPSANLPVPYGKAGGANSGAAATPRVFAYDPAKGSGSADLSLTGAVSWRVNGDTGTFNQGSVDRVVLNWDSFNIGAGYKVHFAQNADPSRYVSALNRIWSADPSVILGSLTADREVILLNANGVYFGRGAVVDTGKFVATANAIADSVFEKGLRNITDGSAVFSTAGADYQATNLNAAVSVEAGAEIRSAAGGDVLLIAPRVVNQGRIDTPQGQAVLAAGDKVYLMSSSDPKQRGLIVAVDPVLAADGRTATSKSPDTALGIVENSASGSTDGLVNKVNEIHADSGTVNLVGLTVKQSGQINATTAVKGANGAVYLQAMATTTALVGDPADPNGAKGRGITAEAGSLVRVGAQLGTVQIGAGSLTAVLPSTSAATQLDAEVFNASRIRVEGAAIGIGSGAQLRAPAGQIDLLATRDASASLLLDPSPGVLGAGDDSRIVIAPGALLSTAGLQAVEVDGARNQGAQRLFRIELADAPVQRSSSLYRSQVYFDLRDASKITAANVTGAAAATARTAAEHATAGGSIKLLTDGALVVGDGAQLDVSGGSVHYGAAQISNSLLSQDGRVITFTKALGSRTVDALEAALQVSSAPAYTEGANGGNLTLSARQMALDGKLLGQTTLGERQRDGLSAAATPAALVLGLRTDNSFALDALRLLPETTPRLANDWFQNALAAPLRTLPTGLDLSLAQVAAGGFGQLALRAAHLSQPAFASLDLGQGGLLDIEAGTAQLDGAFRAAGGKLSVTTLAFAADADNSGTGDLLLSGRSVLDSAGQWTNDTPLGLSTDSAIGVNGGSVALKATHALRVGAGARLDVSAGARLAASGTATQGKAGSLSLKAGSNGTLQIDGAVLRGFDFTSGGTLTLATPALTIGDTASDGGITLAPDFFSAGGFGNITVNAAGAVRIASGSTLAPHLRNWQFAEGWRSAPSGAVNDTVVQAVMLDSALVERKPVNLSLTASGASNAPLTVERGATIALDPGASLSLSSADRLLVGTGGGQAGQASTLSVPGGSLTLALTGERSNGNGTDGLGFMPNQALWLGADAHLSVDGLAQLRRDGGSVAQYLFNVGTQNATPLDQRLVGTVLGGGSITLNAARGYVVAQAGSTMSLNGASAAVNYTGLTDAVTVAKAAGTLSVSTPEGFALEGSVSAQAPRGAAGQALADGGKLSLSVGRGGVYSGTDNPTGLPYDTSARSVAVGNDALRLAGDQLTPGVSDLRPLLGNGTGFVRSSLLKDSGWGALTLGAGDAVRFDQSLSLTLPLGLVLDAPALAAAPGVQVRLSAGSAQLGDATAGRKGAAPDTAALADGSADASTTLRVSAPTIDVYGNLGLQGFGHTTLDAGAAHGGEVRFSAAQPNFNSFESLQRQLNFAGTLDLVAGQVYATSATQYTLSGLAGSTLAVQRPAGNDGLAAPLSAYGSITANATDITQGGTLRQPFGQITLNASRTLTLGDGSITSVSGDGATVLFGQTLNLSSWLLPSGDGFFALASNKAVSLTAAQFVSSPTALVSTRGGGALRAWEFFPGVGGSADYFNTSGLYAVLPDYAATQTLALDGGIVPASAYGQQVIITQAGSGLAPGRYTLLPARYALLGDALPQGAFLVSRASDQGKTLLRAPVRQDDGSVVVTGYLSSTGASSVGAPGERFTVESAATYNAKSEIRQTDVSNLLQARASAGQGVAALPRDAGQMTLRLNDSGSGSATAAWQAELDLAAVGGRAGTLDVSARNVALVDTLDKAPAGALGISAGTLAASGAGSVLLGGIRSVDTSADAGCSPVCIDTSRTTSVSVNLGKTELTLEELLLGASQSLTLAEGTTLSAAATGTLGARTLASHGDGVLLAVCANALALPRTGAALQGGALTLGANSVLSGRQLSLDATGVASIAPSVQLNGDAVSLGAQHLVVGTAASTDALATPLQGQLLATLRRSADLSLRAYTSIDFAGVQNWSQRPAASGDQPDPAASAVKQRLVLDAPVLRGVAGADGQAARTDITAQDLLLRNTTGMAPANTGTGSGTLLLQAVPPLRYGSTGGLSVGPGQMAADFNTTVLRSSGDAVLQGSGGFSAQQDLSLSAARLTASTGADQALTALGALRIGTEAGSHTLGEQVGLGAKVTLSGATLTQDGTIDLPGAQLSLKATGGDAGAATLSFGAGSSTSVAGFRFTGSDGSSTADGAAGSLLASAASGRIALLGTLDASAARRADGSLAGGDGGSLTLQAVGDGGTLVLGSTARLSAAGGSAAGDLGGRLTVDLAQLASADALASAAASGGVTGSVGLRVRSGDLSLDRNLSAAQISLSADAGRLLIGATSGSAPLLDAHAAGGGVVQLAAGGDLVLGTGARIGARNTAGDGRGGDVLLASSDGTLRLASGAVVDAADAAGDGGRIVLRARRADDGLSVAVAPLNTANLKAAEVAVEAVRVYEGYNSVASGSSNDTTLGQASVAQDNAAFMARAATLSQALGIGSADASRVQLRAGVELRTDGDLSIDSDWNLGASRPGGHAGFLTLRASGNLLVNNSISDGFASTSRGAALNSDGKAWSLRLAAGADLGAALPTAVADHGDSASDGTATLTIAAGALVRTGAASLDLAAGRDLVFAAGDGSSAAGQAYVAGRLLTGTAAPAAALFVDMAARPQFTTAGGRLTLNAVNDVVAPEATQLINNWYWRSGLLDTNGSGLYRANAPLAWWSQFSRFEQTLGAFGGGSIDVQAGRDIVNLQAMAPSAGWADSRDASAATLRTLAGGTLAVRAGRDLLGGQFLLGQGVGRLDAGGSIAAATANANLATPVLALNDGQWRVTARSDVTVAAPFNPTAAPAPVSDNRRGLSGYFYTWGADAGLQAVSKAGSVQLQGGPDETSGGALGLSTGQVSDLLALEVTVPTLRLSAARDIGLLESGLASAVMFPSASGQLALWSGDSIRLGVNSTAQLAMADSDPAGWGTARAPGNATANPAGATLVPATLADSLPLAGLHAGDAAPATLHAEGALQITGAATSISTLLLAKAAVLSAGTDVLSLSTRIEQLSANDVSTLSAGRNLLAGSMGNIEIAGPGRIDISAGRDVDLGASGGISTTGNLRNANLPAQGASVRLSAASDGTLDLAVLAARYLAPADQGGSPRAAQYRAALLAYVRDALQQPGLDDASAWAQFQAFPAAAQARFGRQLLASEFSATYLTGSVPTAAQMTDSLRQAFERDKAQLLLAGEAALAAGQALTLPGRETLTGSALSAYLVTLRGLAFSSLDLDSAITARLRQLATLQRGWQQTVAAALGGTVAGFEALTAANPRDAAALAWRAALADTSSSRFTGYRDQALAGELASTGTAASQFGRLSLPMRLAFFEQGFQAAELAGVGSFSAQAMWAGAAPLLRYSGAMDLTQSSVVTERGGDISLVNPGGAVTVGLKDNSTNGGNAAAKGVITLGGGNVFGYARNDFQVNTQRVFIVGQGDMSIWSSVGDIDSGRGANTAVAAPPLAARRSIDGVVFETPATTTGSGLGILEDSSGRRSGTIGLFPAFGEILALDAFIRAPSVVLGSSIKGADNLLAASVGGAAAPVAAPALAVAPPASQEARAADSAANAASQNQDAKPRNALLTVDLLGLGPATDDECAEKDKVDSKCPPPPARKCSDPDKAKGLCK